MVANNRLMKSISDSDAAEAFGPRLELNKELAKFTTYGTGGPARFFIGAKSAEEIVDAVQAAQRLELPYFLLGGGSNVLFSDDGFEGLIIKVAVTGIDLLDNNRVFCGAGEELMTLVNFAADHSLAGLEFAAGIYGSVGGAVYGNAGAFGGEIGNVIQRLTLVDKSGAKKQTGPEYCEFGYRDSKLKRTSEVVVDVTIELQPGDQTTIKKQIDDILTLRRSKHPVDEGSAGSFFKNIPDPTQEHGKLPAGKLLEQIGAKGMQVGGAKVYDKHANIIINNGGATSKDIADLADILKNKVKEEFGIILEEEVIKIGKF